MTHLETHMTLATSITRIIIKILIQILMDLIHVANRCKIVGHRGKVSIDEKEINEKIIDMIYYKIHNQLR